MASERKFVRLKYDQLAKLTEGYEQRKEPCSAIDTKVKKPAEKRRSSKKPEIEYYRPGVSRLSKKTSESEPGEARDGELQNISGDFRLNHGEPAVVPHSPPHTEHWVEEGMDAQLPKQPSVSGTTQQRRPRQKRPDQQIYIPKARQQHLEQQSHEDEHTRTEGVVSLDAINEELVGQAVEGELTSQEKGALGVQRLVDVVKGDSAPLRITLVNQNQGSKAASRARKHGDENCSWRHHEHASDHVPCTESHDDSLEWDYEGEMEMGPNSRQVNEDTGYHYGFDEEDVGSPPGEQHQQQRSPPDKKRNRRSGQNRNRSRNHSGREPQSPTRAGRDTAGQPTQDSRNVSKSQQKKHNHPKDPVTKDSHHRDLGAQHKKDDPSSRPQKSARALEKQDSKHLEKANPSPADNKNAPTAAKVKSAQRNTPKKTEELDATQKHVRDQLNERTFQGMVFTNSKFEPKGMPSDRGRHRSSSPEELQGSAKHRSRNGRSESMGDSCNHFRGNRDGRNQDRGHTKKDSHSSRDRHDSTDEEKKSGLRVTFSQNEKRTQKDDGRSKRDRCKKNSKDTASAEEISSPDTSRGGGLIRLPAKQAADTHSHANKPHSPVPVRGARGRGRGTGRGGTHRILYDPNNPKQHLQAQQAASQQQLHFHDPCEPTDYSPDPYRSANTYYYEQEYSTSPQARGDGFYHPYHPAYCESGAAFTDDIYNRDPYYHGESEQDALRGSGGQSKMVNKAKAEAILREALPLDSQLSTIISRGVYGQEGLHKIMGLRHEVQNKCEQVILLEPDLANKHNVEHLLWKSVYYQIIELFRRNLQQDQNQQQEQNELVKDRLLTLLDEGVSFYEGLLRSLQSTYGFILEEFLDLTVLPRENISRTVKLALLSAQRTMICLGDIARYREQTNQTSNYGKARSWYMKAQQIAPKNGRPYNQLAILALYTRRKLDAVYFYMRSLAASNPFLTARESLMSLFDEARKKAVATEQKRVQEQTTRASARRRHRSSGSESGHRVEVWVSPDGSTAEDQIDDDDDEDLNKMPSVELNKKFILSYLNVHGKLFTKIGMETFPEMWAQMLLEFRALICHSPAPVGNNRLLQLMAINMYAIENVIERQKDVQQSGLEENCRSLLQEQAVQLGLDMFGLLVQRCTTLFKQHLSTGHCQVMNEDLHQFFPSVKVWSDWMMCHMEVWNPPPLTRDPDMGPSINVWQSVADLCNVLGQVDISHVKIYTQKKEGCDPVLLAEDTMMGGFVPLLGLGQLTSYVHSTVDKDVARDCLRVEKFKTFGDYLCGIESPLLSYNVETHQYESIAPDSEAVLAEDDDMIQEDTSKDDDDVIIESDSEEADLNSSCDDDHIRQLRAKKQELERRIAEQTRYEQNVQATLEGKQNRPITLEIHPQFLVPDTNCFIDHQLELQNLLGCRRFTIVVPLVVINELDGLAKGNRAQQYESREHAAMVKAEARSAVQFLEEAFESRNSRLRAVTSKGSTLDTIAFRSEEGHQEGNNDDIILSCCLHYCKDMARDYMPKGKDGPIRLQREVVLLTDDRNLRLKAHMRNVPVKDIPAFLAWAKIT